MMVLGRINKDRSCVEIGEGLISISTIMMEPLQNEVSDLAHRKNLIEDLNKY